MEPILQRANELIALYGMKVIAALAIFLIGRVVVSVLVSIVRRLLGRGNVEATLVNFVSSLTKALLMTFVIVAALGQLGIDTTSIIAVLGAAGIAVGFALQDSLGNFASGIMLIVFRPFKKGDFVEAGGTSGVVEEISIFSTILKTGDNKQVIVPNGKITGDIITNYSARETRRLDLVFGIGYGDDLLRAKKLLEQIVREESRVLDEPTPLVAVHELADSSVNFVVRPWVKTADYWPVYFCLTEKVKLVFDQEGISIPFPQQDIHIHQVAQS